MKKFINILYNRFKQAIPVLVRVTGVRILNKQDTLTQLKKYQVAYYDSEKITINPVQAVEGNLPESFSMAEEEKTSSVGVYRINADADKVTVFPYGGVKLNRNVLDMDFGSSLFISTLFKADKRPVINSEVCIVLWSHNWGGGYYDYLFFIYSKLLRIKEAISSEEFVRSKIAYPTFGHPFEIELLKIAGIEMEQVIDTRKYNVKAGVYYLSNNDSWYYHNVKSLSLVRNTFLNVSHPTVNKKDRIYISRKGRRKLVNEKEIIEILKTHNFTIVEDKVRPVAEQIDIYKNAAVIIGPHGASFANIVCCAPGTTLIELFPRNYYPSYFKYLATVFKLKYIAFFEENIEETHYSNSTEDVFIDPLRIRNALNGLLI